MKLRQGYRPELKLRASRGCIEESLEEDKNEEDNGLGQNQEENPHN